MPTPIHASFPFSNLRSITYVLMQNISVKTKTNHRSGSATLRFLVHVLSEVTSQDLLLTYFATSSPMRISMLETRICCCTTMLRQLVSCPAAYVPRYELEPVLKVRGNRCTRIRRIVGRQVHIRLMLISIVDHQATFHSSQVGFIELAKLISDCSRRMDTIVALSSCKQD